MKLKEAIKKYSKDNVGISLIKDGQLISIDDAKSLNGEVMIYGVYDLDFMTIEYEQHDTPIAYIFVPIYFALIAAIYIATILL